MCGDYDDYEDEDPDHESDSHHQVVNRDVSNPIVAMAVFERQKCLERAYAAAEIVSREHPDLMIDVRCVIDCPEFLHSKIAVYVVLRDLIDGLSEEQRDEEAAFGTQIFLGTSRFEIEQRIRQVVEIQNRNPLKKPILPPEWEAPGLLADPMAEALEDRRRERRRRRRLDY